MKNKVLIFDFDGTIADTFHAIVQISNQLADEFHFKKLSENDAQRMKDNSVRDTIKELNVPLLKIPLIIAKAKTELLKNISLIKPVEGLTEILMQMRDLGATMGILTSNSLQNVEEFLKNHDLQCFDFINTTSKIWSKDHILPKLIDANQLDRDQVIYIGDETRDIDAAKRSGIKCAAVTWGYNSEKALSAHQPDFLFTRPVQLLGLLE